LENFAVSCLADQQSAITNTHSGLSLRNRQWPSDPHRFATCPNPQASVTPSNQQYPSAFTRLIRGFDKT
jgi:hypothetical protein